MYTFALKMLIGDRSKYVGLLFGVTFTSFLVTFAISYFSALLTRSFSLISENPGIDVWVMDPAVQSVDQTINMPDSALNRVRSVQGVAAAVPMGLASVNVRFPNGRFQPVEVIGVDDATLAGLPRLEDGLPPDLLRRPDAVAVDDGGTRGKLDTPSNSEDEWPRGYPRLDVPMRPLVAGDELLVEDHRVVVVGRAMGLPRFPPRPLFYTRYSTAEHIVPREFHQLTFVMAKAAHGVDPRELAQHIQDETGLRARDAGDFRADTVWWTLETSEDVGDAVTMLTIAMLVGFGVTGVMMFMFTTENLKYYALFNAMGATGPTLYALLFVQAGFCALLGTGIGIGFCGAAGSVFTAYGFPFRMMWFAPLVGAGAVILVSVVAAVISVRPVITMEPTTFLSGR